MANYDAIIALVPSLNEEKVDGLVSRFEKRIKDNGGEVQKVEKWGMKRLNYEFKNHKGIKDGFYILIAFSGSGKAVTALRDTLRLQEEVIRQMITRAEEEAPAAEEAVVFPDISAEQPSGKP
ncbi:MAG TPA: 30S ribosomal protein S6 [Candidatus Omnitrophota bacterium]|nr:30S ribosomal protein S6 [Candidatus Omnitrophota bacterium]